MSIFGQAAVSAVDRCRADTALCPIDAWVAAVRAETDKPSPPNKNCPKKAFLGLIQAGAVVGIAAARHPRTTENGRRAVRALEILRAGESPRTIVGLWRKVAPSDTHHDGQMNVVLALWDAGYLEGSRRAR